MNYSWQWIINNISYWEYLCTIAVHYDCILLNDTKGAAWFPFSSLPIGSTYWRTFTTAGTAGPASPSWLHSVCAAAADPLLPLLWCFCPCCLLCASSHLCTKGKLLWRFGEGWDDDVIPIHYILCEVQDVQKSADNACIWNLVVIVNILIISYIIMSVLLFNSPV